MDDIFIFNCLFTVIVSIIVYVSFSRIKPHVQKAVPWSTTSGVPEFDNTVLNEHIHIKPF